MSKQYFYPTPEDDPNYQYGTWYFDDPNSDNIQLFTPPVDTMNNAIGDWTQARPMTNGKYGFGGEDTFWDYDPSTGTATVNSQEGANSGKSFLDNALGDFAPYAKILAQIPLAISTAGMSIPAQAGIMAGTNLAGNIIGNEIQGNDMDWGKAATGAGMSAAGSVLFNQLSDFVKGLGGLEKVGSMPESGIDLDPESLFGGSFSTGEPNIAGSFMDSDIGNFLKQLGSKVAVKEGSGLLFNQLNKLIAGEKTPNSNTPTKNTASPGSPNPSGSSGGMDWLSIVLGNQKEYEKQGMEG